MSFSNQFWHFELNSYYSIWIASVLYSLYSFGTSSYKYFHQYNDYYNDFTIGWDILQTKKDKADFEWESIMYFAINLFYWMILATIANVALKSFIKLKHLQILHIIGPILFITIKFGLVPLLLIFSQLFLFLIFAQFKTKYAIYFCNLFSLGLITLYKLINASNDFLNFVKLNEFESYYVILALCWGNLRCTAYFLDNINSFKWLDYLSYNLYFPTVFFGPFIPFNDYMKSLSVSETKLGNVLKLFKNLLICLVYTTIINFALHYVYLNATGFQLELVESFNAWSLYGYGYAMGQFFHMKYIVLYGLSTSLASFDNVPVPNLPRCIGRVHLYSDMWKYFDPGLYTFLIRYIYKPILRSESIISNKLGSSAICFLFVTIWHGSEENIMLWGALNFLGISLEALALYSYNLFGKDKRSGSVLMRRLKCLLAAPLLAVSAISNFIFFAGVDIGNVFFRKLFNEWNSSTLILIGILYTCCQVSTELRSKNARCM